MTRLRPRRFRLVSRAAVPGVLAVTFFAFAGGPGLHAAQDHFEASGVVMTTRLGGITLSGDGAPPPTGVWTGPPEQVGVAQQVSYSNGHTVYVAYFKGLGLSRPGDSFTQILATDSWRTLNSTYSRSRDTIELIATNGTPFRRQYTPTFGVVAVIAPTVSEQAASTSPIAQIGKIALEDGSTQNIVLANNGWAANYVSASYLGRGFTVTADPDISLGGVSKARIVGDPGNGIFPPSVFSEIIDDGTTFAATVGGFSDDMHNGTIYAPPQGVTPSPDITITLLQGYSERRTVRLGWTPPGGIVTNANSLFNVAAGSGVPPVPPPPPTDQQLMRFAILYVPGDTGEAVQTGIENGGK